MSLAINEVSESIIKVRITDKFRQEKLGSIDHLANVFEPNNY